MFKLGRHLSHRKERVSQRNDDESGVLEAQQGRPKTCSVRVEWNESFGGPDPPFSSQPLRRDPILVISSALGVSPVGLLCDWVL